MYVHHLGLYCILFRRFLISKINVALQLTKLWLKKVTTTTENSNLATMLIAASETREANMGFVLTRNGRYRRPTVNQLCFTSLAITMLAYIFLWQKNNKLTTFCLPSRLMYNESIHICKCCQIYYICLILAICGLLRNANRYSTSDCLVW